jgi:hypothetical protein
MAPRRITDDGLEPHALDRLADAAPVEGIAAVNLRWFLGLAP